MLLGFGIARSVSLLLLGWTVVTNGLQNKNVFPTTENDVNLTYQPTSSPTSQPSIFVPEYITTIFFDTTLFIRNLSIPQLFTAGNNSLEETVSLVTGVKRKNVQLLYQHSMMPNDTVGAIVNVVSSTDEFVETKRDVNGTQLYTILSEALVDSVLSGEFSRTLQSISQKQNSSNTLFADVFNLTVSPFWVVKDEGNGYKPLVPITERQKEIAVIAALCAVFVIFVGCIILGRQFPVDRSMDLLYEENRQRSATMMSTTTYPLSYSSLGRSEVAFSPSSPSRNTTNARSPAAFLLSLNGNGFSSSQDDIEMVRLPSEIRNK